MNPEGFFWISMYSTILTFILLLSVCNSFFIVPRFKGRNENGGVSGGGGKNGPPPPPNPPRSLFNNFGDGGDDNGGRDDDDWNNGMRAGSVVYGTVGMIGPGTITRLGRVCQRTLSAIEDAFKQFGGGGKDRKAIADLENTVVLDVRAPNSTILPVGVVREGEQKECEQKELSRGAQRTFVEHRCRGRLFR